MNCRLLRLREISPIYETYPDAHVVLSALYTITEQEREDKDILEGVHVSGLLPILNEEPLIPAPTLYLKLLGDLKKRADDYEVQVRIKKAVKKVKRGGVFLPISRARDIEKRIMKLEDYIKEEGFLGKGSSFVEIREDKRIPRAALDRVTANSHLFFSKRIRFYGWTSDGERPVRDFGIIVAGKDGTFAEYLRDLAERQALLSLGGRKGTGGLFRIVGIGECRLEVTTEGGVLLSLADAGERPPEVVPLTITKYLYYPKYGGPTKRLVKELYFQGSFLRENEFNSGDIARMDGRYSIFVRPLFLRW